MGGHGTPSVNSSSLASNMLQYDVVNAAAKPLEVFKVSDFEIRDCSLHV